VLAIVVIAALALFGCSRPSESRKLEGEWEGGDWGRVAFVGMRGRYTGTYGPVPGEIVLEPMVDGQFEGTWGEGETRRGKLSVRFESADVVVGRWTADPDCTIRSKDDGLIRWSRRHHG
jgi:hypothetical protein